MASRTTPEEGIQLTQRYAAKQLEAFREICRKGGPKTQTEEGKENRRVASQATWDGLVGEFQDLSDGQINAGDLELAVLEKASLAALSILYRTSGYVAGLKRSAQTFECAGQPSPKNEGQVLGERLTAQFLKNNGLGGKVTAQDVLKEIPGAFKAQCETLVEKFIASQNQVATTEQLETAVKLAYAGELLRVAALRLPKRKTAPPAPETPAAAAQSLCGRISNISPAFILRFERVMKFTTKISPQIAAWLEENPLRSVWLKAPDNEPVKTTAGKRILDPENGHFSNAEEAEEATHTNLDKKISAITDPTKQERAHQLRETLGLPKKHSLPLHLAWKNLTSRFPQLAKRTLQMTEEAVAGTAYRLTKPAFSQIYQEEAAQQRPKKQKVAPGKLHQEI